MGAEPDHALAETVADGLRFHLKVSAATLVKFARNLGCSAEITREKAKDGSQMCRVTLLADRGKTLAEALPKPKKRAAGRA